MMRRKTRLCSVRRVHVLHPYRTASIASAFKHWGLGGERRFLAVELTYVPPDAHPARAGPTDDFIGRVPRFGYDAPQGGEGCTCCRLARPLRLASSSTVYAMEACTTRSLSSQETVRAKARQTSTASSITLTSTHGDYKIMQASSAYSIPHTA